MGKPAKGKAGEAPKAGEGKPFLDARLGDAGLLK